MSSGLDMVINNEKGAYMYYDDNVDNDDNNDDNENENGKTHVLYLYLKLTKPELKRALPLSYVDPGEDSQNSKNYLNAIFVNGRDYLGQTSLEEVITNIKDKNMVNIITNDYEKVSLKLPNLTQQDFNNQVHFSQEQLEINE